MLKQENVTPETVNYFVNQITNNEGDIEKIRALLEQFAAQTTLPRKRKATETLQEAVQNRDSFEERVKFYTQVVNNTLRKLPLGYRLTDHFTVSGELYGISAAENTHPGVLSLHDWVEKGNKIGLEDELWFKVPYPVNRGSIRPNWQVDYKRTSVPAWLLWNDPIRVAQHVRTQYPMLMREMLEGNIALQQGRLTEAVEAVAAQTEVLKNDEEFLKKWEQKQATKNQPRNKGTQYPGLGK